MLLMVIFFSIIRSYHHFLPLPHLEHLVLKGVATENAANILHANPQLQHLTFASRTTTTFDQVVNLLGQNSSISKLYIDGELIDMNEVDWNRFSILCPMIEELSICCHLTSDQAFILINELSSLKRFEFGMIDHSEYDHLVNRIDNAWNHSFYNVFDYRIVAYLLERKQ